MTDAEYRGRKRKTGPYASKYYDPDKAHEYYMKHRKLKALKGGSSKKKISKKRKKVKPVGSLIGLPVTPSGGSALSAANALTQNVSLKDSDPGRQKIKDAKASEIKKLSEEVSASVDKMRKEASAYLKGHSLTSVQKAEYKQKLNEQIKGLREQYSEAKKKVNKLYSDKLKEYNAAKKATSKKASSGRKASGSTGGSSKKSSTGTSSKKTEEKKTRNDEKKTEELNALKKSADTDIKKLRQEAQNYVNVHAEMTDEEKQKYMTDLIDKIEEMRLKYQKDVEDIQKKYE